MWQEVIYELMREIINLQGRHAGNLIDNSNLPRAVSPGWELDPEGKRALEVTGGRRREKTGLVQAKSRTMTVQAAGRCYCFKLNGASGNSHSSCL